jgi:hypothetical protein
LFPTFDSKERRAVIRKVTISLGIAVFVVIVIVGWQIGSCELANMELQDDMQDLASQAGAHIGFVEPRSDEDLRRAVMRKAKEHDIDLDPEQVSVQRSGSAGTSTVYLAADYTAPVKLPGGFFTLHFKPSAGKKMF